MAYGEEEVMRSTALGILDGSGKGNDELFMTYHPNGWADDPHSSSAYSFADDAWLDSNGIQSGHYLDVYNYEIVKNDYDYTGKPTIELEAVYEHIYNHFSTSNHRFTDYDTRSKGYWAVFAGAAGYTYGNNAVWQFYRSGLEPRYYLESDRYWYDELDNPSAQQMTHLRSLMESRPMNERMPDQSVVSWGEGTQTEHAQAMRADDGSYAMVYIPIQKSIGVNFGRISGTRVNAWWYNPRDGSYAGPTAISDSNQVQSFTTPSSSGPDWVLVIDDASKGYGPPGA
jgi:hypothetical protein